jgi:hypothetical protein
MLAFFLDTAVKTYFLHSYKRDEVRFVQIHGEPLRHAFAPSVRSQYNIPYCVAL